MSNKNFFFKGIYSHKIQLPYITDANNVSMDRIARQVRGKNKYNIYSILN